MQLTAEDRTPEPGDVLTRGVGSGWAIVQSRDGDTLKLLEGNSKPLTLSREWWRLWYYFSRADGGPLTKEGE